MEFHTEHVDTAAGTYAIEFHSDAYPDQPYDDGLTLAVNGWARYAPDSRIDIRQGEAGDVVWGVLETGAQTREDYWDWDRRSGAALVRYLRLKGLKGVTLVDRDYRPVEPSTDRFERVYGVAWAPDDATQPDEYVTGQLREWRAWAEGDAFGYIVKDPHGDEIDSCWGYYGWEWSGEQFDYVMSEARASVECDAENRIAQANLTGSGIVGLI